jgi:hypothetical protein
MDTYAAASQQAVVLPQQTPAPSASDGGLSSDLAAAVQSIENSISSTVNNLVTALQGLLSGNTTAGASTNGVSSALSSAVSNLSGASSVAHSAAATSGASTATATAANAATSSTGSLLPIQATYYATMLGTTAGKMFMSVGNSMTASQAMQAGQQAMLADVQSLVDGKLKALLSSISGQMRGFGSQISAQLAGAGRLSGLSVPHGWAQNAPEMVRAAPVLPANSIAPPVASAANLPTSPYTQALMGAMNGRGLGTQAAKTASVKVETRTPAGG